MKKNLGKKTYIYPQPVLILGTYDENGNPNLMNAAWGGMYDYDKIFISLSEHKTTDNLAINKAFTVGIGDEKNVVACDYVGIVSGRKEPNKVKKSGFTTTKSEFVNAPIVNELPITIECEVESFNDGVLIGVIKNVVAEESVLDEDGQPNILKVNPLAYDPGHHKYVTMTKIVGQAFSEGKKIK